MAGKKKTEEKKAVNELSVSTELFKSMVAKAYKGVGNNKLLPLTQLMCIEVKNGELRLIVSDSAGTNYFYVTQPGFDGEFYATVMAEQFAKLVGKFTCEKLTLSVDADKLKITGNGNYTIALQYDEMGNSIQYPDPISELGKADGKPQTLPISTIYKILNTVKPSLALTMEVPYLTNYYIGDMVAATNSDEAGIINNAVMKKPVLLSPIVLELLGLSSSETVEVNRYADGVIVFSASDMSVYSREMDGIDEYPIEALREFYNSDMPASCKLPKNELLQALDRISLFVGAFDENAIQLEFTGDSLKVSSLAMTGVEAIKYISGDNAEFKCSADLMSLIKHIKTQSTDDVEMQFGSADALKFVDGDAVQIVSLFQESEE